MMSAQRANETRRRRAYHQAAIVPVMMPPYTPSPEYGGRMIFIGSFCVQVPLVDDVVQPATDQGRDRRR